VNAIEGDTDKVVTLRAVGQKVPFRGRKIAIPRGQRNPNGGFAGFTATSGPWLLAQAQTLANPNNPY
jgi:hypothetical protein